MPFGARGIWAYKKLFQRAQAKSMDRSVHLGRSFHALLCCSGTEKKRLTAKDKRDDCMRLERNVGLLLCDLSEPSLLTAAAKNLAQGRSVKKGQSTMKSGAAVVCTTFRDTFGMKQANKPTKRQLFTFTMATHSRVLRISARNHHRPQRRCRIENAPLP